MKLFQQPGGAHSAIIRPSVTCPTLQGHAGQGRCPARVWCSADAVTCASSSVATTTTVRPQPPGTSHGGLQQQQLQQQLTPAAPHVQQPAGLYVPVTQPWQPHLQRSPPLQQQQQQPQEQALHTKAPARGPPGAAVREGAAGAEAPAAPPPPRKRHKHKQRHASKQQQAQARVQQQAQAAPCGPPLQYPPCGKRDGLRLAVSISRRMQQGRQVLVPAGAGMQLVRSAAMLSTARTLLLSSSSTTGLVFQPTFSAKAAAAVASAQQPQGKPTPLQPQQQQQQQEAPQPSQPAVKGRAASNHGSSSGSSSSSNSNSVMLLVAGVQEAQLRRFDASPLIAAPRSNAGAVAGALVAKLRQQGFTTLRAAGPDATRVALLAAAHARRRLVRCGLDLAVVPATEFVDVEGLTGPDGSPLHLEATQPQGLLDGLGPGEEVPPAYVRVTLLHVVRCEPQRPWQLLPWPAAAQPRQQQAQQQQQQQQAQVPLQAQAQQRSQQRQREQHRQQHEQQHEQQQRPHLQGQPSSQPQQEAPLQQQRRQVQHAQQQGHEHDGGGLQLAEPPQQESRAAEQLHSCTAAAAALQQHSPAVEHASAQQPDGGHAAIALALDDCELEVLQLRPASGSAASHSNGSSTCASLPARQAALLRVQRKAAGRSGARQLVAACQAGSSGGGGGGGAGSGSQ